MDIKFYSAADVKQVLKYEQLIPEMENALRKYSSKEVEQPLKSIMKVSESSGFLSLMPAYVYQDKTLAVKVLTFFPQNQGVPSHHALIIMFNPVNGVPQAIMDGNVITTMRTAAVSAVATKYLAKKGSSTLAILGAGNQARSHFEALSAVMNVKEVRIYSRTFANAEKLANEIGAKACTTAEEAVKDADVIVTATSATTPILKREWVKPGAHINAIGACRSYWNEIDPDLMRSSVVHVDSRETAEKYSGDIVISKAQIYSEIGEIILGIKEAYREKTTVFKSLGLAVEDALSANLVQNCLRSTTKV